MATNSSEWKKRESFGSALVQIFVVALVLGGIVFMWYNRGVSKKEIAEKLKEARAEASKGNPANIKKGLALAEEALAKDANSPDGLAFSAASNIDLFRLYKEPGADAKAKDFLERAKKAEAKTEDRYGSEAQMLLMAGQFKEADAFVEDLRKKGGSGPRLSLAQADALKAQGNLKLARAAFHTASEKSWKDANYACAEGEAILDEGALGAVDLFRKTTGQHPDHLRARLGFALARVQKKDQVGEAANIIKDVMSRDAELSPWLKARALAVTAGIFNIEAQSDAAIAAANNALESNPDDAWALYAKANALTTKKDPTAGSAWMAAIAKAPAAPAFYFQAANSLQAVGQGDAAMGILTKYEEFFRNVKTPTADGKEESYLDRDDRYYLARGDLLKTAGKLDEAMTAYDKAIAAKSLNATRAYFAKASLLIEKKEVDKAMELLADITPPDGTGTIPEAYMAVGNILLDKKDYGPGCQNYAFALAKMKAMQVPREKINEVLVDVEKKLIAAKQKEIAKQWMEEAKPLIQ
jgi:hypothetical protein